jgi:hypothetical protein
MKNERLFLNGVLGVSLMLLLGAGLLAGCAAGKNTTPDNSTNTQTAEEEARNKIVSGYRMILEYSPKPDILRRYLEKNIANVLPEQAQEMVNSLEKCQKEHLPTFAEERYDYSENIQLKMGKLANPLDLSAIQNIEDRELKGLLTETVEYGYKIETAEGMYFPVIDYEKYRSYSAYVTADLKDYIELMAVESNKTPLKDAALMISWDEVLRRALAQEKFLTAYKDSPKAAEVTELYRNYVTILLFGANNTPLFSYDTNVIVPEAKAAYLSALQNPPESALLQTLKEYMDLLAKNNYKLTDEVQKYRQEAAARIKTA